VQSPNDVRKAVEDYLREHVWVESWERLKLDGVVYTTISKEENERLMAHFLLEEFEVVVKESDGNKSPRLNGFNFASLLDTIFDPKTTSVVIL
jgi:hypothetical protein